MKEVIEDILDEEKKARERVEQAKEKAKQIRLKAEEDAKHILQEAKEEGKEEANVLIARAEKEAEKEKEKQLTAAARISQSLWEKKQKEIKETVEILFNMVLGEEIEK